uniref:HAT C-terminal dimerisation domain-containing protein n=1 Tax=Latimeria chalumnae TaxID=7897 RepID=H3B0M5_LATCH
SEKHNTSPDQQNKVVSAKRKFHVTTCQCMKKKFPYNDPVLLHAEVANIKRREQVSFQSVEYFVNQFPALLPTCENTPEQLDELQNEFFLYQVDSEIDTMSVHRIDHAWVILNKKYKVSSDAMLGILVILHSNADCDRVFSIVTKNQTAFCSNMSLQLLESLLIKKINNHGVCYEQKHLEDLLKAAKKATYAALHDD